MDSKKVTSKLGSIGKVSMCKRVLKHQTTEFGEIPFYKISTFGGKADSFITKDLYDEFRDKYSFPKKGDILISAAGTIGETVIYDGKPAYFQDSNIVWIDNDETKILNSFLYYFYQTKPWLTTNGSTIKRIYNDNLRSIEITYPESLQDQQKIAAVLTALDAKIELNARINAELESMAKTLYDYWFVQFAPHKSAGGKMVWSEVLKREIPLGWEVVELGDFVDIFDSKRIPLSSSQRAKMQGQYPYYGATSIMDYVNDYIFDGEYLLIAEDGSVMGDDGLAIVQYIWGKTWVNNHAHVLLPKDSSNKDYLYFLLKSISVIQIMTGSIQKKITQDNLLGVKFALPDKETLKLFSEFARPIRQRIFSLTEESQTLTELRDWLLPMLMNGQVQVQT